MKLHSRNIPSLDGLRAVSILLVILAHAEGTTGFPAGLPAILTHHGALGVQIFFVISGFLITTLALEEERTTGRISLRLFYARRALRIFPPFFLFLGVLAVCVHLGALQISRANFLFALTYTTNYAPAGIWITGHLWSLSVEEQFYLAWPLLLKLSGIAGAVRTAAVLAVFSPWFCLIVYWLANTHFSQVAMAFPFVADSIASGCVLAAVLPRLRGARWFAPVLLSRAGFAVPGLILLLDMFRDRPRLHLAVGEPLLNLAICYCLVRYTEFPHLSGARLLNTGLLSGLGKLSYSLYLWQQPFLNRFGSGLAQTFPLNVAAAFGCAFLSYTLIEKPSARLRARFRPGRATAPGAQSRVLSAVS